MEETKENPWTFNGETEFSPPSWAVGMVYKISKLDKFGNKVKIYIGKKSLCSNRKGKVGKREIAATGTRKRVKRVIKDSGWSTYWSSCKELQQEQKEHPELFVREILEWCFSKKNMTYKELWCQFWYNVLEKDTYNSNLNGSLYRHDTDRQLYEEFLARKRKPKEM